MKYLFLLFLINFGFSNIVINLDKLQTYNYKQNLYGPSSITITGTGLMGVTIDDGWGNVYGCMDTSNCSKQFDRKCWNFVYLTVIITSETDNNEISIVGESGIGCSLIAESWVWLTALLLPIIILPLLFIIFICACNRGSDSYYKEIPKSPSQ